MRRPRDTVHGTGDACVAPTVRVSRDRVSRDANAIKAPCPHYPHCAGCAFIGIAYGEQLRRKEERVRTSVSAYPRLAETVIEPIVGSPRAFGYRNQAKLVARRARGALLLGVYEPGTHQVVDISGCPVHHPLITRVLAAVRGIIERQQIPTYDERTATGWLRYVVVRASMWQKTVQLIAVVRERSPKLERAVSQALQRVRHVHSVVLNVNPTGGNVIFGETFIPLTRVAALIERVGPLRLKSHAGAFLQANIQAARRLYDRVLAWADPAASDTAVDLYAGVGAISFYLAGRAQRVYGIEESEIAVRDAKENIRLNGFHNVRFFAGRSADVLPRLASEVGPIDLVTLNPPRKGADAETRAAIVTCDPRRIVYVSCDPASLARDLDWFAAHGYATERVQPFDLLPQTEHVESVALLRKSEEPHATPLRRNPDK
jgi:23S rRNA (uracil1939-C5)-methyltransferase